MIDKPSNIKFAQLHPVLNSHLTLYMLEKLGISIQLISPHTPENLIIQLWTNIPNKRNSEGSWHPIDLQYQSQGQKGELIFTGFVQPTSPGNYQLTYRAALKAYPQQWQWAGQFQENSHLTVNPPSDQMNWTQGPSYAEILPHIYVGNLIAASQAIPLGFDAVLNLAEEFPLSFPDETALSYHHLKLRDGAVNPIPESILAEAIAWIDQQRQAGKQKILVNCRAGIGRSGSIGIAYCFYHHQNWTYDQTLNYIWQHKPDIYPHQRLQESLETLFPRR